LTIGRAAPSDVHGSTFRVTARHRSGPYGPEKRTIRPSLND